MAANQGSRAGLITTVVLLSIVSVVATIFAFWYGAEKRRADQTIEELSKRYSNLALPSALSSQEYNDLLALRGDQSTDIPRDAKVWDITLKQRNDLVKMVTGQEANRDVTAQKAIKDAQAKLAAINDQIKAANTQLPSTTDNLLGAVDVLADKVKVQADAIADRDAKLQDAEKRALDAMNQRDTDLKAKDDSLASARADADKALKDASDDRSKQDGVLSAIEQSRGNERKTFQDGLAQKDALIKAKDQQLKQLTDRMAIAQAKFDRIRVAVAEPVLRHSDGVISGLALNNLVYINLGEGKHIVPGLTFEVYDKVRGVPKMTGDPLDQDQPAGKASIEVVRVLGESSECRVTRLSTGQQIQVGDTILNVVYDPNLKYNFYVFGRFDLDHNGVATLQDTELVKRLITQWGGSLSNKITPQTDFVVVGAEPTVPNFTQEELNDPLNVKKQTDAQAELDQYLDVVRQAKELHLPILNQNRFVYFTGQEALINR